MSRLAMGTGCEAIPASQSDHGVVPGAACGGNYLARGLQQGGENGQMEAGVMACMSSLDALHAGAAPDAGLDALEGGAPQTGRAWAGRDALEDHGLPCQLGLPDREAPRRERLQHLSGAKG